MLVSTVYFSCRTPYAVHLTIQCLHASLGIDKYGDVCKNNGGNTINISSSNHLALAFDAWTGAESLQSATSKIAAWCSGARLHSFCTCATSPD